VQFRREIKLQTQFIDHKANITRRLKRSPANVQNLEMGIIPEVFGYKVWPFTPRASPPESYVMGHYLESLKLMAGWVLRWLSAVRGITETEAVGILNFFTTIAIARTRQANHNSSKAIVLRVCLEQSAQELMILYAPPLPGDPVGHR
jgi:hypothetical protein